MLKKILTVAGSDSSGGAGMQADLKTFEEFQTYGFCAITSFVTMDPDDDWAHQFTPLATALVEKQLRSIFTGGTVDAMKTGMMGSAATIELTAAFLQHYDIQQVVVDPVIISKGTTELIHAENIQALKQYLLPQATITTPNLIEAGILSELGELTTHHQVEKAAQAIKKLGVEQVLIKGGDRLDEQEAADLLYDGAFHWFHGPKIDSSSNHGAGCMLSAAITAELAKGKTVFDAVASAKKYVAAGVANGVQVNPYLGYAWTGAFHQAERRIN